MLKKLFTHTAIYGLAPQIPKVAAILVLPIITPYLYAVDFAVYGLVTAAVAAISVFANLGMNVILSNSFFKDPDGYKQTWRKIYGFLILWNIPYAFILGAIIYFFIPKEAAENTLEIIIINVLPVVLFGPTAVLGALHYQLSQKPYFIVIRSIIIGFVTVILNLILITHFKLGYMGWFISAGVAQILLQTSYWWPLNRTMGISPIFKIDFGTLRKQLKVGLPTVPHYYGVYLLNTADRLVMKMVGVNTADIGAYNATNTVGNGFLMAGTAAGQAVSPMLMAAYKNNDAKLARKLIFVLQVFFLSATFMASLWLREIFAFLIKTEDLQNLYSLGIIIIMAYNYRPMYFGANFQLFYYEKTHILMKVTLVAGILCFVLNFLFIPIWGYQVAAYTTFLGLLYMGYSGYFLRDYKKMATLRYYPILWLLATVLLTVLASFAVDFPILYKIALSGIVLITIPLIINKIARNHDS